LWATQAAVESVRTINLLSLCWTAHLMPGDRPYYFLRSPEPSG
jgi:hypothetical protein